MNQKCSFCEKHLLETDLYLNKEGTDLCICTDCIEVASLIISHNKVETPSISNNNISLNFNENDKVKIKELDKSRYTLYDSEYFARITKLANRIGTVQLINNVFQTVLINLDDDLSISVYVKPIDLEKI